MSLTQYTIELQRYEVVIKLFEHSIINVKIARQAIILILHINYQPFLHPANAWSDLIMVKELPVYSQK